MAQPGQKPFTDEELRQFASDPDLKPEDLNLLSSGERSRLQTLQAQDSTTGHVKDVLTGVGKGAGETAFDLGSLVHKIPLIGDLTDKLSSFVGPDPKKYPGADPSKAFAKVPDDLEAKNDYQKAGKTAEQVGEFFVPAPSARLETIKGLVKLIPDTASPEAMRLANRVLAHVGRVGGEAGSAGAVSAVHGDDNPGVSAAIAGATSGVSEGLGPLSQRLLKTKLGQEIAPMLAAIGAMHMGGGMSELGLGAGLGTYGILKRTAGDALANPKMQAQMGKVITKIGTKGGELAAGLESESRVPQRRRLKDALSGQD